MDAKLTENVNFVRGTGKDFVLQFITNHISCVIYAFLFGNNRETEMQRSTGTFLCCLATASDKNITISTKYDKYL